MILKNLTQNMQEHSKALSPSAFCPKGFDRPNHDEASAAQTSDQTFSVTVLLEQTDRTAAAQR